MTSTLQHHADDSAPSTALVSNESFDLIGGRLETVAHLGGTARAGPVLFRGSMAPGRLVPLHSHVDSECFYVLSGRLEVFLLDSSPGWHEVPAGRSLALTDGIRYAVRNPGRDAAEILILADARLAAFFRDAGRPAAPGSDIAPVRPEHIERVARTAEAYGYWMASPAEHAAVTGEALPSALT